MAAEGQMNRLAVELGMDPVELRLLNCFREGDIGFWGAVVPPVVSLPEVIEACADRAGWSDPPESPPKAFPVFRSLPAAGFPAADRAGIRLRFQECRVLLRLPRTLRGGGGTVGG